LSVTFIFILNYCINPGYLTDVVFYGKGVADQKHEELVNWGYNTVDYLNQKIDSITGASKWLNL